MKKIIKTIASFVVVLTVILSMGMNVFAADSSVTYEGGAEKFVFLPGSEYTSTDLFDGFKGVMPGDVRTETIIIQNKNSDSDYVRIYMRAMPHDQAVNPMSDKVAAEEPYLGDMLNFLSQLSMTVKQGENILYNASPNDLDGLRQNVLLGEFDPNEKTELTVELRIPIELDNEYANRVGEVDWVFVAEELNNPDAPQTGDQMDVMLMIGIMIVAVVVMIVILYFRKKDQ